MAGIFGANTISALRLLSPSEISRITGVNSKKKVNSSGQIVSDEDGTLISADGSKNTNQSAEERNNVLYLKKENQNEADKKEDSYKDKKVNQTSTSSSSSSSIKGNQTNKKISKEGGKKDGHEDLIHNQLGQPTNSKANNSLEMAGIYSAEKIRLEEETKRKKEKEKENEDSSTIFLLKEKDKVKESQKKLKIKEVLESYKNNANMDLNKNSDDDDLSKYENQGILLNKKQY